MIEPDFTGLSLLQRRFLQPVSLRLLPDSPRPIAGETLSSYCLRLGRMFNSDMGTLLCGLGIPPSVAFEVLETLPCSVLSERLANVTGRPIVRFVSMQLGATESALKVAERTAFCPGCWLERRRGDAAYLAKAWARPWVFFCPRHPGQLLHELAAGECWTQLFGRRSQWAALIQHPYPAVWRQACVGLDLDPLVEWAQTQRWLCRVQHGMQQASTGRAPDGATRIACDLANYLQIVWPGRTTEGAGPAHMPTRVIDEDTCHGRMLVGSLGSRLRTLILVRHVMSVLSGPQVTRLGQGIAGRLQSKPHAEVDRWWLRRRLLSWPEAQRRDGHALFGLALSDPYAIPPFDACRRCVYTADPPLEQRGLHFVLSGAFCCLNDAWRACAADTQPAQSPSTGSGPCAPRQDKI